jgi:hypothetical protein
MVLIELDELLVLTVLIESMVLIELDELLVLIDKTEMNDGLRDEKRKYIMMVTLVFDQSQIHFLC